MLTDREVGESDVLRAKSERRGRITEGGRCFDLNKRGDLARDSRSKLGKTNGRRPPPCRLKEIFLLQLVLPTL